MVAAYSPLLCDKRKKSVMCECGCFTSCTTTSASEVVAADVALVLLVKPFGRCFRCGDSPLLLLLAALVMMMGMAMQPLLSA